MMPRNLFAQSESPKNLLGNNGENAKNLLSGNIAPQINSQDVLIQQLTKSPLGKLHDLFVRPATLGMGQTLGDTAASVANLIPGVNIPHPNLKQFVEPGSLGDIGFGLGQIGGALIPIGAGFGAFGRVPTPGLVEKIPQLIRNMGKGAAIGYATGEGQPGDREFGAVIGGLSVPAAKIASIISNITNTRAGKKIIEKANQLEKAFSQKYEKFHELAEKAGVREIPVKDVTQRLVKDYSRIASSKYVHSLKDALKNPTLRNVHDALKDVKAFNREMKGIPLTGAQRKAVNAAEEIVNKLTNNMSSALESKGGKDIFDMFEQLNRDYRKQYVPYLNNKNISNARLNPEQEGFIEPYRLPSKVFQESGDSFRRQMLANHPELIVNRMLASPYTKGAAALYGGNELLDYLKNG